MEVAPWKAVGRQDKQHNQPNRACPRCNSTNTKFCYFNNYSLTQPRYFCKGCRRYWTHGGGLRSVPVGGSSHKSKRQKRSSPPPEANAVPPVVTSTNLFQRPVLEFDLAGGWRQSFNRGGGDGSSETAATGAQFWTLGGAGRGDGEQEGGSSSNQWRNFSALSRGGDDDDHN